MIEVEFETAEQVPEALKSLAEERDGTMIVKLEDGVGLGVVAAEDLATEKKAKGQFRDNNNALKAKLEASEKRLASFDGVDPVEYKRIQAEHADLTAKLKEAEAGSGAKDADVNAIVAKAVAASQAPMQAKIEALTKESETAKTEKVAAEERLVKKELEAGLTKAGLDAGVDEKAIPDFLSRGLSVWKIVDGKQVALDGDGEPMYDQKGEPVTMTSYAAGLQGDAPHLFKPSSGGGAKGTPGGAPGKAKKTITDPDAFEFGQNIEGIAKGEIEVVRT